MLFWQQWRPTLDDKPKARHVDDKVHNLKGQ
jgi:hypothetical protein